jgi:mono/diheme cytochrome c family protein
VIGPLGRLGLVLGEFQPEAIFVRRDSAAVTLAERPVDADTLGLGRYVARTSCTECHGADLRGHETGPPSLVVATGYAPAEFRHFLRSGTAKGGRELPLMSDMARERFSHLTDAEVAALHAYLRTLAASTG